MGGGEFQSSIRALEKGALKGLMDLFRISWYVTRLTSGQFSSLGFNLGLRVKFIEVPKLFTGL
jgi:hypothetical protein